MSSDIITKLAFFDLTYSVNRTHRTLLTLNYCIRILTNIGITILLVCIWLYQYVYYCINMYMIVSVCIWLYQNVYDCISMLMNVSECIWLYQYAYDCFSLNYDCIISMLEQGCNERFEPFYPQPDFTAFRAVDFGFTRMTFHNGSHLQIEHISDDQVSRQWDQSLVSRRDWSL